MTRRTSIDAYNAIKDNGLLGKRQFQVYDALYREGPMTANQVYELLKREDSISWISNQGAGSRLSELREMGCIAEVGRATDPFTKMSVILWDVTDQVPEKAEKKISKDEIIAELRKENESLRQMLRELDTKLARMNLGKNFGEGDLFPPLANG